MEVFPTETNIELKSPTHRTFEETLYKYKATREGAYEEFMRYGVYKFSTWVNNNPMNITIRKGF